MGLTHLKQSLSFKVTITKKKKDENQTKSICEHQKNTLFKTSGETATLN